MILYNYLKCYRVISRIIISLNVF